MTDMNLYQVLGIARDASAIEVRRAYRTLSSRSHPDKGGHAEHFKAIQAAYAVLSHPEKRKHYDETGEVAKTASEEFLESFSRGSFADPTLGSAPRDVNVADQIILHQGEAGKPGSHTGGFQAWLRSRGGIGEGVFDGEAAARAFGVVKSSYAPVLLPPADAFEVRCSGPGKPKDVLVSSVAPLPACLDWGQVLVDVQLAPVNPADLYTVRLGGVYGSDCVDAPFVAGHDGVGIVTKIGPGVKQLQEGDTVLPLVPFLGTWRTQAVWSESDLLKVPQDVPLTMEYLAASKELCLAYCLLERYGRLKPGDCVILNASNSTVGQALIQLCKLLRLRVVAVARDAKPPPPSTTPAGESGGEAAGASSSWLRMVDYLKAIGATEVLKDEGSFKVELDNLKFFARPKLALDAVGGESGLRLAEALAEGGELVTYGCMSGRAPPFAWQAFVFRELRVSGFNFRRWLRGCDVGQGSDALGLSAAKQQAAGSARFLAMLRSVSKLVAANLMSLNFTEYDMDSEFEEALDHATDSSKNTKVLLRGSPAKDVPAHTVTAFAEV